MIRFDKGVRKADVMRPYLDAAAAGGKPKVVAIGVAQEFQRVFTGYERPTRPGVAQFGFAKADRRVSVYYFYLWDSEFGPGFIKVATYFPYPMKIWVNGHEWAKRQAAEAGIGFSALSNGFAGCEDEQLSRPVDRRVMRLADHHPLIRRVVPMSLPTQVFGGRRSLSLLPGPATPARTGARPWPRGEP